MAQNISLMGATYSAVPAVTLPKQGGGTATFTDVTDTTAAAADVASGKYFYTAAGVKTLGTASGGGSNYQTKTATPATSSQIITADAGYDALAQVNIDAIPSQYIVPAGDYSITSNGNNIDIAQYATVSVNVPGGGSSYTAVANKSYTISTSSTSAVTTETWSTGHSEIWTSSKIVYIRVRDTVGARAGYFYGTDNYFFIQYPANGATNTSFSTGMRNIIYCNTNGKFGQVCYTSSNGYGIYADTIYNDGRIRIRQRYNVNYSLTINSTYKVEVYLLGTPDNVAPYVAP